MRIRARSHLVISEITTDVVSHPASIAWLALERSKGRPRSIDVLKERREADGTLKGGVYRLHLVDGPAPTVIAKRCRENVLSKESYLYREVLSALPIIALETYGECLEPQGTYAWLFLEDAGSMPLLPDNPVHTALPGTWLARLRTGARGLDLSDQLPRRDASYYRDCLQTSRDAIESRVDEGLPSNHGTAMLTEVLSLYKLTEGRWDAISNISGSLPATLVHGDFVAKNMCLTETPEGLDLILFDWQTAGWGSHAVDLAGGFGPNSSSEFLIAYQRELSRHKLSPTMPQLQQLAVVGKLFRTIVSIHWDARHLERWWPDKMAHRASAYVARLRACLDAIV